MSYSYSGDPSVSALDWVRFRVSDTASPWTFTDEEISAMIAECGTKEAAAAALLQQLAVKMSLKPDFTIGDFSEKRSAAAQMLNEKSQELASAGAGFGCFAGGVSVSDKAAREADTDNPAPAFRRGMMRMPGNE